MTSPAAFEKRTVKQTGEQPVSHDVHLLKRVLTNADRHHSDVMMVNHVRWDAGASFSEHSHESLEEFFYVISGEMMFRLTPPNAPAQEVRVAADELLRVSPGVAHSGTVAQGPCEFLDFGVAVRCTRTARVEIEYCTQCRWMMRAAWTAQELLTTFAAELGEVALVPGTGGVFDVRLDGRIIYSRKSEDRFPEMKELKQLIRDQVAPERDLGHSDRPTGEHTA